MIFFKKAPLSRKGLISHIETHIGLNFLDKYIQQSSHTIYADPIRIHTFYYYTSYHLRELMRKMYDNHETYYLPIVALI